MRLEKGAPGALGAHWDGEGVNFALRSRGASQVELCLFDEPHGPEVRRLPLLGRSGDAWHGYLQGAGPGLLYGYRVHGPWRPEKGERFDPSKLLVDPYARALSGPVSWDEALVARPGSPTPVPPDTAPYVPRGVVIDPAFDWGDDRPPRTPWSRSVLYECHVKGMTELHPDVPADRRGRFLGLSAPAVIGHLRALGVTAVSLLPVQHASVDAHLGSRGLTNYWGYGTLGFFAPDSRFASGVRGEQVREFRAMVRELHEAGLEVILDVVYNHTPETDPRGATFGLRGIDDAGYYRADSGRPGEYEDFTGCGNTVDLRSPPALELVVESLRYWVSEMRVDGFRFDLMPALCRDDRGRFDPGCPLLAHLQSDPLLSGVKLVAEPWDLGPDPVHLGAFPEPFVEWNHHFRDSVRRFWFGDARARPMLAAAIAGSSDVFAASDRGPQASVNFVTCHDGHTLADVVRYSRKHNEANLEDNRDGRDDEPSCNWGDEGPSRNPAVLRLRERARRNLAATLALSLGTPMLSHGDEVGRSQDGNNNAYCHDSELTWIDWRLSLPDEAFADFVKGVFALRRANAVFRRRRYFDGEPTAAGALRDVTWLRPDGGEMTAEDWSAAGHALGVMLSASGADREDERGRPQAASTALLLFNSGSRSASFALPHRPRDGRWRERLDTAAAPPLRSENRRVVRPHSMQVLEWEPAP